MVWLRYYPGRTDENLRRAADALAEIQTEHKLQKQEWKQLHKTNLLRVPIFQKSDQHNNRDVHEHQHKIITAQKH
jgi:hypothetical protein